MPWNWGVLTTAPPVMSLLELILRSPQLRREGSCTHGVACLLGPGARLHLIVVSWYLPEGNTVVSLIWALDGGMTNKSPNKDGCKNFTKFFKIDFIFPDTITQGVLAWHVDFCTPAHISVVIPRGLSLSRGLNSFFYYYYYYFYLALPGLSRSMWDLVPQPGIEPGPFALGACSLSHGTTRDVPEFIIDQVLSYSFFSNS